jgi:hypothetical protein
MARLTNLLLVTGCIGSPYAHIPLWEKVFYKIENDGILFLGSEIRRMPDGCGFIRSPGFTQLRTQLSMTTLFR